MKARFTVALLAVALAIVCSSSMAQEQDAQHWYKMGLELNANQSFEEALQAYEMAIKLDPKNPEYWGGKANSLWLLHRNQDATDSWKKSLQLYNDTLQKNPQDVEAWLGKGRAFAMLAWSDSSELSEIYGDASLNAYDQALQIDPQNSTLLSLKGGALFSLRRYEEAILAYDAALEIGFDPSHQYLKDGIFHMKGLAKAALGEKNDSNQSYQEALKGFDEVIEKADTPENLSQAWLSKGFILQEQDNYNESVKALDNATKANPRNEMAWRVMGFMLGNWMGRYQEGLQALDKALEIRPTADVWEAKSRIFNELGRYQDAIVASENALELNQNLTVAWQDKGHALTALGRYQEALDAFDKAIDAYDEQIFAERGFALAGLNRSDEAAEAFGKSLDASEIVLEKDNKSAYEWFWKGEALRGLNRYQDALDAYNHSLEIGPYFAISSWRGKSNALSTMGHESEADAANVRAKELGYKAPAISQENTTSYWLKKGYELSTNDSNEQALQAYEKVISIDSENSLAWINKAYALSRLNRTSESNQAYNKALEITNKTLEADPRNATLWLGKGILLNNVGNVEESVKAFDNANKIDPKNEMAWMMKGVLLSRDLQRYDDAVKAFDSALQINPKNAQVWSLKGDALKALGRQSEADEAYAKAKELGYTN